jgi:hypothetical protein
MEYLDTLRRDGWIADPTDRVRVQAVHDDFCPATTGRTCWCNPRLVMAEEFPQLQASELDRDLPLLDAASGE